MVKLKGKIYISNNKQGFISIKKAILEEMNVFENGTPIEMDIENNKIVIDIVKKDKKKK